MEDGISQYDDSNRAFLQAFLARGTLTYDEAKPVLAAIFSAHEERQALPEDITEADFNSFIHAANDAISPFDLAIRSTLSQHDRSKRIFALINTTSDPITQLATTRTPDEIAYVKRLLDAMFITHNTQRQEVLALTSMQAARLHKNPTATNNNPTNTGPGAADTQMQSAAGATQSLTMTAAENVLRDLVDEGWLEKSRAGFYALSPRALMELRHYLLTTYNGADEDEDEDEDDEDQDGTGRHDRVKLCHACKEIVTIGQRCPTVTCPCRLHNICVQGFFTAQRSRSCPFCKVEWTGENYVGEKAVTTTEAWQKGRRRSSHATASGTPNGETVNGDRDD